MARDGTTYPSDPGSAVSVGTSSTVVRSAANPDRWEIDLTNTSSNWIYVQKAATGATVGSGIALAPNGGNWSSEYYDGPLCAIATGAGSNLAVSET